MKRKIYFLIISLLICTAGHAQAGEKLSLKEALKIAFDHNPSVVEARQDIKIAESQFKISKKWDNPELEVEVGNLAKDLDGDSSFSTKDLDSEIRVTQPIDGWGKRGLRKKIAEDELKQQEAAFKSVWLNTVKDIKEQYTQTLLSKKAVELSQENLELNQKFLDKIKIKFDSGDAVNHELSRAKLEVINARHLSLSSQKKYLINKGKFNLLLGQPMSKDYNLIDNFQDERLDKSFDELLKMALEERPDVFTQKSELNKKDKELRLAKRDRLPSYGLSIFVEREENVYKGGVGVAFDLPIWNFKSNEITQVKLEREKAQELLKRMENEVALDVYIAFHETDLAKKSHDISIEAIKEANEILRFTTLGYEEGEVTFLSYLENVKAYQETKQRYFESLSEYTIKIAELEQVIGEFVLPEENNN